MAGFAFDGRGSKATLLLYDRHFHVQSIPQIANFQFPRKLRFSSFGILFTKSVSEMQFTEVGAMQKAEPASAQSSDFASENVEREDSSPGKFLSLTFVHGLGVNTA